LIIKISGGSMTYGGRETLSNSRGTGLAGEGSDGVIGKELVGPKKVVQPLLAASQAAKPITRAKYRVRESIMAFLNSLWAKRRRDQARDGSFLPDR
jgi:hypothetical protein